MEEKIDETIKIIILGSTEVGKTSILDRYFNDEFRDNQLSTVGIDFQTKFFKFEGKNIKGIYTDTAGQEKFRAISVNYLKPANGVILVFDITKEDTFDALEEWLKYLKDNGKDDIQKILIGNKLDLEKNRKVTKEDAEDFAKSNGCKYFETSAKTGVNVNEALDEIARITYLSKTGKAEGDKEKNIVLNKNSPDTKKKKCC